MAEIKTYAENYNIPLQEAYKQRRPLFLGNVASTQDIDTLIARAKEEAGLVNFNKDAVERENALYQQQEEARIAEEKLQEDLQAWNNIVDDILAEEKEQKTGKKIKKNAPFTMLSKTPLVLEFVGGKKELPVKITYNVIKKIANIHNLADELKQIPQAMTNPIAIFESATIKGEYVMMLELLDSDKATVVVPISLSRKSGKDTLYEANIVTSAYGKLNEKNKKTNDKWFNSQIENGRLKYWDEKKYRDWLRTRGLQLPKGITNSSIYREPITKKKKEVKTKEDFINLKNTYPTFYQLAYHGTPHNFDKFNKDAVERENALYQQQEEEKIEAEQKLQSDLQAWNRTVDKFESGELNPRKPVIMFRNTPLVLSLLGADKNLTVSTNYRTLNKVLHEKHKLPVDVMKQVPKAMTDPIMIFKSATVANDYVMMLDLKDEHGATVVVPVSLNYDGIGGYKVNYALSIYGKKNEKTNKPNTKWFIDQIEQGNLVYQNNKKSREWWTSSGKYYPRVGSDLITHGRNKNILTDNDLSRAKQANPTYYQNVSPRGLICFNLKTQQAMITVFKDKQNLSAIMLRQLNILS